MEEHGGLPKFVVDEFEQYLDCGRLEKGCLLLECRACGYSQLVALSCKRRSICNSCVGRRMADTAVHLERHVLPEVPVRHWICSLPWGLRALLGYDRVLCSEVLSAFIAELSRSLKRRAKQELGLSSVAQALTGAVAAVQRVDSALRLNVHFHVLSLDGVYVRESPADESSSLVFHSLPTPTSSQTAELAKRTAERIERILQKHGKSLEPELADPNPTEVQLEHPALAACYEKAALGVAISGERAGQPPLRLVSGPVQQPAERPEDDGPIAEARGINLYGRQRIDGRDRRQLERVCRYILRPAIAQDRLSERADGTLLLELKKAWKDGTRALVLEPHDLLLRLVASVPPPRFHMIRYFGVLSSHSTARDEVIPEPAHDSAMHRAPPAVGDQLELLGETDDAPPQAARKRWSWLLRHIFQADLDTCPKCGGYMRWAQVAKTESAAARLMAKQGMGPRPPPDAPHVPLGQLRLPFEM